MKTPITSENIFLVDALGTSFRCYHITQDNTTAEDLQRAKDFFLKHTSGVLTLDTEERGYLCGQVTGLGNAPEWVPALVVALNYGRTGDTGPTYSIIAHPTGETVGTFKTLFLVEKEKDGETWDFDRERARVFFDYMDALALVHRLKLRGLEYTLLIIRTDKQNPKH